MDHLFLHCKVVCALWNAFFNRLMLSWVMPSRMTDLFAYWWTGGRFHSVVMWKIVPSCLLWYLWKERNDRNFED